MARSESFLDERRERLAGPGVTVNGIAAIEVDATDMTRLTLHFVHPLPGQPGGLPAASPALRAADLVIGGGDRIRAIAVLSATANGRALALQVNRAGDFSAYTLRIRDEVPGYDPILREIGFRFRLHCDSGDCAAPPPAPPTRFRRRNWIIWRATMTAIGGWCWTAWRSACPTGPNATPPIRA